MRYTIWLSHTCWVCTGGGSVEPTVHASSGGYRPTSPCDTLPVTIDARDRGDAVRQARSIFRRYFKHCGERDIV